MNTSTLRSTSMLLLLGGIVFIGIVLSIKSFLGPRYIEFPESPLTLEWRSTREVRVITSHQIWDVEGNTRRQVDFPAFDARRAWLSPDGQLLAFLNRKNTAFEIWDIAAQQQLTHFFPTVPAVMVAWSHDSHMLAIYDYKEDYVQVFKFDAPRRSQHITIKYPTIVAQRIDDIAINANVLAVSYDRKEIILYDLTSGRVRLRSIDERYRTFPTPFLWNPTGDLLISGNMVFRKQDRELVVVARLSSPASRITSSSFDQTGIYFASIGGWAAEAGIPPRDRNIYVWNMHSFEQVAVVKGQNAIGYVNEADILNHIRLSPDAQQLASIDGDGVRIWELDLAQPNSQ